MNERCLELQKPVAKKRRSSGDPKQVCLQHLQLLNMLTLYAHALLQPLPLYLECHRLS